MKITLTTAESARLIELGIDPSKASMVSWKQTKDWQRKSVLGDKEHLQPKPFRPMVMGFERFETKDVFNLTDLLAILPKEIEKDGVKLTLAMDWDKGEWYLCYNGHCRMQGNCNAPELIDSLYSLLIWAIEQGHIKTDKK